MQALYLMALEPITESEADANSYGFRKFRSTADAIDALHRWLSRECSPQWILEGDIKGYFNHINHERLLNNVQIDRLVLRKWLKSGVVFNKLPQPTLEGTPQGGIHTTKTVIYSNRATCKVKCETNPFAPSWVTYVEKRKRKYNCQCT